MSRGSGYLLVSALVALGGLLLAMPAVALAVDSRVPAPPATRVALALMPEVHCSYPG